MVAGVRHGFASVELKLAGSLFVGFKSINYSRKRNRAVVRGNHPDPLGKTRGENEYSADCEVYFAEWQQFMSQVLKGPGYGDAIFTVLVTYGENGFDTVADELIGCSMDSTEASNSQGPDPTVRKFDLGPIKIKFGGVDDLTRPLVAPAGT